MAKLPDPKVEVGACVIDLDSGQVVFGHREHAPMIPASTMKLFVMAAALTELGPDFRFETLLATDGIHLIVIGDGDPGTGDEKLCRSRNQSLTSDFERWAATLQGRGLTRVSGELILDESIFDEQRIHPSWEAGDLGKWYAAPVGALNFNDNCVDITVTPAGKPGTPVRVSVQPPSNGVKIVNGCRSGGKGEPVLHHRPDSFEYELRGRCSKPWTFSPVSFPDPGLLFGDALRLTLNRSGVSVEGPIVRRRVRHEDGSLPAHLAVLDRIQTPIGDVLRRIGKDSQNFFAECLLKRTGYAWARRQNRADPQGSWTLGSEAVVDMMRAAGTDAAGLIVADGSGLSRRNSCTARQLASVLAWMHGRPGAAMLRESLSINGVDGSYRKRLTDMAGVVYCKTGTMRGVRALAGYVIAPGGREYAFAVMFNGYKGSSAPYKQIQDDFCRVLAGVQAQRKTADRVKPYGPSG
jgi:D-alanyl-D-alanine carboxypeptidase/D-alanyl-D-alanine-endopeptidase (penicillin-binding protein 4)